MNLPKHIDSPSPEAIEAFGDIVNAFTAEQRRVLNAVSVVATIEQAARVTGISIIEIPAAVGSIAKCKPRDELIAFEPRAKSFFFKTDAHADSYAEVMKFVAAFTKWANDPQVVDGLGKAETHRAEMHEARRAAA